jgi:methylated-DNA-[protein]-cysteine S-methyltransferase
MGGLTYLNTPLGDIRITCNGHAITSISFLGETEGFGPEYPSHLTTEAARQIFAYLRGKRTYFDFPYYQEGTEFQQSVWSLLQHLDCGQRISYQELAVMLGDVNSVRAVAAANAKNNLLLVVPCHRVVGADGNLTGYVAGLWRKEWLLNHESRIVGHAVQMALY